MKKPIVWRPSTAPEEYRAILTVRLPPETKLPPTPKEFQQAINLKMWGLVRRAIEEAGSQARWEVGERMREALPGANVEPDELDSLEDALMMSDQMMGVLGSIEWEDETSVRPLLTSEELADFEAQTLDDVLASL